MAQINPDVAAVLLARGFAEVYDKVNAAGGVVQQDSTMPTVLRRGLALLSGLCVSVGVEDLGASVHVAMNSACEAFSNWGLPYFDKPFRFSEVVLIDRELGIPTPDCRELASMGGSEISFEEDLHHTELRSVVKSFPARQRDLVYTAIREFVVRNPSVAFADREHFIVEENLIPAARTIATLYRPVSHSALFDGEGRRCGYCNSLLWPDRDTATYPAGRCRIRQCRQAHPEPVVGQTIADPKIWQLATAAVLAYWVGPGLDEIRIFDALKERGKNVVLYPQSDAADVGLDGSEVGIDVKTYASPVVLASKLTKSIGRLSSFRRRILAVPDDKLHINPRYLEQLRDVYKGETRLEFKTVSQAIETLS